MHKHTFSFTFHPALKLAQLHSQGSSSGLKQGRQTLMPSKLLFFLSQCKLVRSKIEIFSLLLFYYCVFIILSPTDLDFLLCQTGLTASLLHLMMQIFQFCRGAKGALFHNECLIFVHFLYFKEVWYTIQQHSKLYHFTVGWFFHFKRKNMMIYQLFLTCYFYCTYFRIVEMRSKKMIFIDRKGVPREVFLTSSILSL